LCKTDQIPFAYVKTIYLDNKNNEVEEHHALRRMTNYYDNHNNIVQRSLRIRFSLHQDW